VLSIVVDRTGVLPTLIRNTPVQPRPRQGKELNPSQSIPICLNEIADVGLYIGLKALPDGCPSSRGLGDYEFISRCLIHGSASPFPRLGRAKRGTDGFYKTSLTSPMFACATWLKPQSRS
jgi:hypothetical protein